jgi:hypothetical protein
MGDVSDGRSMSSSIKTMYRLLVSVALALAGLTGSTFGVALDNAVYVFAGLATFCFGVGMGIYSEIRRRRIYRR